MSEKNKGKFFLFEDCLVKLIIVLILIFIYFQLEGGI